ncbi:MAG: ABC transporter permease, partial [Gemmatimonadetes bacterium]|nr:ABC transporter permease [Gemmatimonadota bacterium]
GQTAFTGIAAHRLFNTSLNIRNEPMTADGAMVSGSYFPVLGLNAAKGRLLTPDDDRVIGANFVCVITYSFWDEKFGRDPSVVGQSMVLNGKSFTIVGVAPEGFDGTTAGSRPKLFVPLSMRGEVQRFTRWEDRKVYWTYLFARLKPGISTEQAAAMMNTVYSPILHDVEAPLQQEMSDKTMASFKNKKLILEPGARGQSSIFREAKAPLFLLSSVTLMVLLIACANIANLLLARGAGRSTEMGVRLALGATRRHLVVQLLTESLMLALAGGVASLFVAQWTLSLIMSIMPPDASGIMHFDLNPAVIAFSALLSIATGFVFGLFPALHSTRADLISTIRAGAGQLTGGRAAARFRASLVTAQIALSMGLLIMSALFLKSLRNVSRVDLGIKTEQLATFLIVPQRAGYDSARSAIFLDRVERELAELPGVTGVAAGLVPLLSGDNWGTNVKVQGFDCGPDTDCNSRFNEISPEYFKTLGVSLKAGREFATSDQLGAQRVSIVNEAFARKFNLGSNPVGKFMSVNNVDSLVVEIVGFVRDVKYSQVKDSVPPVYYSPWRQDVRTGALYFYVKSQLPPEQLLGSLRGLIKRLDPNLPVEELKTMTQQVKENVFLDRLISTLSASFALLATLLAGVGLYGVLAYSVQQRTREIGVRMALGAEAAHVRGLVVRQVGVMLAIGGVIGLAGALGIGRLARSLLFELQAHDPIAISVAVVLLACVALAAGWIPARRAAGVDPMHALRYD